MVAAGTVRSGIQDLFEGLVVGGLGLVPGDGVRAQVVLVSLQRPDVEDAQGGLGVEPRTCWTPPSILAIPTRSPLARATWGSWLPRWAIAGSTPSVPPAPELMMKSPVKDRS